MIEHTFQMLPSVGKKKERCIWESGVLTWDEFLSSPEVPGIRGGAKERDDSIVMQALELLDAGESSLLGDMLPKAEHWRMYDRFRDGAAYLDIETDCLSRDSLVTVVTVHRKSGTATLTEGIDLDAETLSNALEGAKILVTFNGSCFDVPVLKNSFPEVDLDLPHYDLRFASRKAGYRGGLKHLEIEMGIARDEDIADVDGAMAVRLWHQWERHGDEEALDILTEYNRADTVNLETIADRIYRLLVTDYAGYRWRGVSPSAFQSFRRVYRTAFWAWSLFSAWSKTTLWGPSMTSAVTSWPLWAGRQCITMQSGFAIDRILSFIWYIWNSLMASASGVVSPMEIQVSV